LKKLYSNKWIIASLVFPGLFLFFSAILGPILLSFYYSLTEYNGLAAPQMIGFENYIKLFQDEIFWTSLRNSLLLGAGFVIFQHPIAMLVAITLDRVGGKVESLLRTVYFIPNIITIPIIVHLWKYLYNGQYGPIIKVLRFFGYDGAYNPLGIEFALAAVLIVCIWHGFGWGMLIYYSGIKNVDPQIYEASALDGASGLKEFWYISLPQLMPIINYNLISAFLSALKTMDVVQLLTGGGPLNSTQFLATYLYKRGFTDMQYGYGCAIGITFLIISIVGTVLIQSYFNKGKEDD